MIWLWLTAALAAPWSASHTVERALELSASVASARAEVQAAEGEVRAASTLRQNPTLSARWAAVGDVHGLSVTQPLSLSGEGLAARQSARAGVDRSAATLTRARLVVAAEARRSWVAAVEARHAVSLADQAVALATRLRKGAEARLASGEASHLDARLARLQETEARAVWMQAIAEEGAQLTRLAAWLGEPVTEIELPADPLEGMPLVEPASVTRSDVQAAQHALVQAKHAVRRERAGTLPPVRLGAFYEREGTEMRAGPSVGVTVPLWSRNVDGRMQARADQDSSRGIADQQERLATAEMQGSLLTLQRLEASGGESDPREQARAALEGVALGYERGELDLLSAGLLRQQILRSQRAWLRARRVRADARIAAALAHDDEALFP